MELIVTKQANQWLINHLSLKAGDGVKFYGVTVQPRQVTHTSRQGYAQENDLSAAVLVLNQAGINYHINFGDDWFFSGKITTVDYDAVHDDLEFKFENENGQPDASTGASSRFEEYWE